MRIGARGEEPRRTEFDLQGQFCAPGGQRHLHFHVDCIQPLLLGAPHDAAVAA
jgi:hypothetical protein